MNDLTTQELTEKITESACDPIITTEIFEVLQKRYSTYIALDLIHSAMKVHEAKVQISQNLRTVNY